MAHDQHSAERLFVSDSGRSSQYDPYGDLLLPGPQHTMIAVHSCAHICIGHAIILVEINYAATYTLIFRWRASIQSSVSVSICARGRPTHA